MNHCCLILLVVLQSALLWRLINLCPHATALARYLKSNDELFENVPFPKDDAQLGRGIVNDLEKLQAQINKDGIIKALFRNYKKLYRVEAKIKDYDDDRQMKQFLKNVQAILLHNFNTKNSYEKSVNQFSDLDNDQVVRYYAGFKPAALNSTINRGNSLDENPQPPPESDKMRKEKIQIQNGRAVQHSPVPDAKDWRQLGIVSSVKNQQSCGSCTLFAAAAALESVWYLWHGGKLLDLSEQQLLDCISGDGHYFCEGNYMESTFMYLQTHGVGIESLAPYRNKEGKCKNIPTVAKVKHFYPLSNDENEMKSYLARYGPITAAIHLSENIYEYASGIFDGECEGEANHSILIVGYGKENGQAFWIVKNSWGTKWGENGYIRVQRNSNRCNITSYAYMITA